MSNAKLLVYTTSASKANELASDLDNAYVITGGMHRDYKEWLVRRFNRINAKNEVGGVNTLVSDKTMATGWRAPKGTKVLFDGECLRTWERGDIMQAMAREKVFG